MVGAAYHAGALAALEHDLGWDARSADVIVGTSAGSLVGALLRLDVPATDLAAMTVGAPALQTSAAVHAAVTGRPEFPPVSLRELLRPRLPDPRTVLGLTWLGVRVGVRALPMVSMLLPDGQQVLAPHLAFFDEQLPDGWPTDPLLICAVRRPDCRRNAAHRP